MKRGAVVYLPSTYNANERFPVLLVFHGSNGTGAEIEKITGLDPQADKYRFVVVYPDSRGPQWDNRGASDFEFIKSLLAALGSKLSLDPQRVYASGYSDGGGFAQLLVCTQAVSYAGIATVGTNMGHSEEARCRPSQPVTYLTFHGTADPFVPYNGGPSHGPYASGGITNATAQVFEFWGHLDGCTWILPSKIVPDRLAGGAHVVDRVISTTPCKDGSTATFYSITGGGHTWPGGTQAPSKMSGDVSKNVDASAIILETLGSHRSAAANACFEGASTGCRIANGVGTQACVGGRLSACTVASCNRGFIRRGSVCVVR